MGLTARPDGFGRSLQLVPGITGIVAATLASWQSFRLAQRFSDRTCAAIATLAIWLGSHAISTTRSSRRLVLACVIDVDERLVFLYWLRARDVMSASRRSRRCAGRTVRPRPMAGRGLRGLFWAHPRVDLACPCKAARARPSRIGCGVRRGLFSPELRVACSTAAHSRFLRGRHSCSGPPRPHPAAVRSRVATACLRGRRCCCCPCGGAGPLWARVSWRRASTHRPAAGVVGRQRRRRGLVGRRGVWRAPVPLTLSVICPGAAVWLRPARAAVAGTVVSGQRIVIAAGLVVLNGMLLLHNPSVHEGPRRDGAVSKRLVRHVGRQVCRPGSPGRMGGPTQAHPARSANASVAGCSCLRSASTRSRPAVA